MPAMTDAAEVEAEAETGAVPRNESQLSTEIGRWFNEIDASREFDKRARKQYAIDRSYAAGDDRGFEVSVNIIASIIEVLEAFLYAQDPQAQVKPSHAVAVNPDLIRMQVEANFVLPPELEMMIAQVTDPAAQQQMVQHAKEMEISRILMDAKRKHAKIAGFGKTLEIVIWRLWKKGKLKSVAKRWVRSAQTVGVGWMKSTWQEQYNRDPIMSARINDLQENLAKIAQMQAELAREGGSHGDLEKHRKMRRDIEDQLRGAEEQAEIMIARGLVFDLVPAENIQVSKSVRELGLYLESPWIDHIDFFPLNEAKAKFRTVEKWDGVELYQANQKRSSVTLDEEGNKVDAFQDEPSYVKADSESPRDTEDCNLFVCVHELWHRDNNSIYTLIEGLRQYARDPYTPQPTTSRFYPFFMLAFREVDGERHPQSLPYRLAGLQDEYNRTRSNFAEHRRRALPGVIFNGGQISPTQAGKLSQSATQEWIGIDTTDPDVDFNKLFANKPVAGLDFALYTVEPIRSDMETVSGAQDAMQSGVRVAKTATEAEIQQSGFGARVGSQRDVVEERMQEVAEYIAEVSLQVLDVEDVQRMAGEWCIWPEEMSLEDIHDLLDVDIQAGSTGKPGTSADREAWAMAMPMIENVMDKVGQLRANGMSAQAEPYVELLRETFNRWGESIDVERFLPAIEGAAPSAPPPMPGGPGGPAGAPPMDPGGGPPNPQEIPNDASSVPTDPGMMLEQMI